MAIKQRVDEIYIVRAIAIIGVLMVHSTSITTVQLQPDSFSFMMYNALNTFFRFGTPTFILLSSFVLFYSYYNRPLSPALFANFYKKRMLYIMIPYLVFSIFYIGLRSSWFEKFATFSEFWSQFTSEILLGNAYTHLYFVFISIQFYLIFPLLLLLFQRFSRLTKHLIWIGFVLQWAFVLMNHYVWQYPNTGSISLSYMAYYFTGAFLGIYYESIRGWLTMSRSEFLTKKGLVWLLLWLSWFAATGAHIWLWHMVRVHGASFDSKIFTLLWNLHTITTAVVLFFICYWIYKHVAAWFVNFLIHLGVVSFGIYLIHPVYLFYFRNQFTMTGDMMTYHLFIAGCFLGALFVSWIIVYPFLYKWKSGWIIFGAKPKTIPQKNKEEKNIAAPS
ncbi:acyltransferase [Halalkalibacter urbisdiaboli]|uniref:acyltransferase n=1 Tax=Halalkalibacter urbisdiaboli TaxID=1960589 RepID=UPI000B452F44|nr:acyltransferase [Halalkalibacter urbisdiaboli]